VSLRSGFTLSQFMPIVKYLRDRDGCARVQ
jgi:hypothetical protein